MLKQEFEHLINKYVSDETFKIYNDMYMATSLSKENFVKLLNIVVIEEEPKVANTRRLIMEHIENLKEEIKDLSMWSSLFEYQIRYKKQEIKHFKDYLKQLSPKYWEEL